MSARAWSLRVAICSALAVTAAQAVTAPSTTPIIYHPDHYEFSASLGAPLHADALGSYPLHLYFEYPGAGQETLAAWQVDVQDRRGATVRRWIGEAAMATQRGEYLLRWNGRDDAGHALAPGFYTVRLRAVPTVHGKADAESSLFDRVHAAFRLFGSEQENQHRDVMVGDVPAPKMPAFHALAHTTSGTEEPKGTQSVPATGSLPFTVYLGNLHSQTNISDGAGLVATCKGEQAPQSGQYGPADAYAMMQNQAHADFLMASEHNHMFDGSTSTNTSANPATAKALFQSGVTAATNYNAAHPGFLALFGVEWGVISNGGHMNIFNPDGLPEWEYNSSNQLIGDYFTPKSDYATMYAFMKQHGWIGMFNHPASTGQFKINNVDLAYDANGDQVMVLAEVLNAWAFSHNTTESEPELDGFTDAFNILLERGYHVAPASDQDNHCSNWGLSYGNRTAVLLPNGTPLNTANFLDALRARRVYATEDKNGQLILTANGQVMGQTISNSGPLTLVANYASSSGQTAARVQFFEGVPGSNGTVAQTYEGSGSTTITPASGAHFYYAEVTQANGALLWSAPIWVNQAGGGGGDPTPPTVSASESGSSGTIILSANASDNVGVSKVEFYVDGVLKGTDTSSPYSVTLDSTTLANGSHTLTAKAYDAAGNVGTSSAVSFSLSNTTTGTQLIGNGGFESGATVWSASSGVISKSSGEPAHAGSWKAWLDGYGTTHTDTLSQKITIPATATSATLTFWLLVNSDETSTTSAYDTLKVQVRNTSGTVLATLHTYSNLDKGSAYVQRTFDLSAYKGQTVQLYFEGVEGTKTATAFVIDDVGVISK